MIFPGPWVRIKFSMKAIKILLIPTALLFLLLLTAFSSLATATGDGPRRTGTFSDMEQNTSTGDITGCEVRIVVSDQGYSGTIQCANAWPGKFLMLEEIRYDVGDIFFKVPSGPMAGSFRGRVTDEALTGVIEFADYKLVRLHLPRKSSFWEGP